MINYFLILDQYQEWLRHWVMHFTNSDAEIIEIRDNITKTVYYTKDGTKHPAITGFQKNSYYINFGKEINRREFTNLKPSSPDDQTSEQRINIKLFDLQFEEIDDQYHKYDMKIKEIQSIISKEMAFNNTDAVLFLVSSFLLHHEIKLQCYKENSMFLKLPTYNELMEMNDPENKDKYNLLQYKKYLSMQENPIWEQEALENFADNIIIPLLKLEFKIPKLSQEFIDILKIGTGNDQHYSEVLLTTIQFIFSYKSYENIKYIYLYDIPSTAKKMKISNVITLEVLLACSKLNKSDPDLNETKIMREISDQFGGFDPTTIRNFIRDNKKFSLIKISCAKDLFQFSVKEIKEFYNNYRKGHGHQPID